MLREGGESEGAHQQGSLGGRLTIVDATALCKRNARRTARAACLCVCVGGGGGGASTAVAALLQ